MKNLFSYMLVFFSLCSLSGCNTQESDIESPAIKVTLEARDVYTKVDAEKSDYINLMNSVQSSVANSYIDDVELITNNPNCENYHSDGNGTAFQANGELALCSFQYYVKNERDASADASAYSVVFAPRIGDSKLDYFTPLSRVGLLSTKVSISLKDELEAEIPIGYRLEESSVSVLGQGKVEIAANDTLEFSSDYEGISRIVYGYTNDVDMIIGMVTIAISDGVNSLPVADDFTYSDVVDVSASVTIDVRDYISDPDNDPLQLVFVDTWNADVFSTEPENIGNTRFTFKADVAGSHIVTYAISDHRGGYSIGLIEVKVIDPAGLGSWGDIDVDKLHFYHPMTREEAVSEGEEYFGIFLETGSSATWAVTTYNVSLAEQLCGPKGHIPSTDEMEQLASVGGVGVSLYDNWPVGNAYLVKDGSSYSAADISGTTVLSGSIPPLGAYVTCAALGEFEVVDSLSRTEDIVANDVDVAKITVSVRMNGVAVTGANVFAEVASGDSSIGIEALNDVTDSEGHAAFEIKSTKAETAQIRLTWGDQEIRQNVTFIGDKETAVISDMLVIKDNAPSVGGSFDEVRASVQDAYNNTIEGQSVEFDTSNIADTYFENVQVKTDSNGHATNKVFWQGPEDYIENQYATIGASTYSTNAGTTSQTTTVTFVSGTLKSFEPVINDQSYNKETSFEAYVEQGDGSPAANRLVRFETYANDAGIVDGEKKSGDGWYKEVLTDSNGYATVNFTWIDGVLNSLPHYYADVSASYGGMPMTLQSHWARYVFCNDKPYGNLDYDFTIHPTDECFVATQPYKDYASSPYKNTIWIGMFGQHLAELLEDAGLLRQISQSEWSTVTSADGTRVASYSSIDRGFLKFHQVRSGDADKTTETSNGTYVREWHQSGMFCDLLAELNVGGRSNWVSTNNTQGQFPFTAEGITHDEELWLSSSAMYKVSSGNWEYSHLRWTGSNWLVTSAEHDEYESFINCQSD